jgi:hypothetical protein
MADMCAELKRLQRGIDSGKFEKFDRAHSQILAANTQGKSKISRAQNAFATKTNNADTTDNPESGASQTSEQTLWRGLLMRDTRALTTHAKLVALGAIAALVVLPSLWFWRASWNRTNEPAASNLTAESNASSWSNATVSRFTDKPGAELFPNFAPDGKSVIYAGDASGNRDIYLQRTGGANPLNLTPDSLLEDTQPAFSPDGERIIFRSARDGGGIFVMGATGESVRRVADFGFNPVWSPDGRHILVATDNVQAPTIAASSRANSGALRLTRARAVSSPKATQCSRVGRLTIIASPIGALAKVAGSATSGRLRWMEARQ